MDRHRDEAENLPLLSVYEDSSTSVAGYTVDSVAQKDQNLYRRLSVSRRPSLIDEEYDLPKSKVYPIVFSLLTATFLASLDTTVVTTLLIDIASDLNAVSQVSWIATSYLLSCSAFQPLFGKLSDIFGRKNLLIFCSICFAVGCIVSTLDSFIKVSIGRFITGIGGGGLATLGTITMSDIIPLRKRGLFQGMTNISYGIGAASGGAIGGILADKFGWRSVFFIQVPICAVVGFLFWWNLDIQGSQDEDSSIMLKIKRIDFLGSGLLVTSLIMIIFAATFGGRTISFDSVIFNGLVIVSILLLIAFTYVELYVSVEPIIPVQLLSERTILASSLANWFYSMSVFSYLFYVPIYFSSVLNFSASENGTRLISNFFGITCGSVSVGYYMKKTGRYYFVSCLYGLLGIIGTARIFLMQSSIGVLDQYSILFLPGAAYACMLTVTLLTLITAVPLKFQASITSIQYTFRSTGSTIGVAIASSVFQLKLKKELNESIIKIVPSDLANGIIAKALEDAKYANLAPQVVQEAIRESYGKACKGSFFFSLSTMILGYICLLCIKEQPLDRKK